jgi:hypothetical protein
MLECIRLDREFSIEDEERIVLTLFENAAVITSFEDLWSIEIGSVSLFHYQITLLPWSFGLNLVRFNYKPRRTLEII